jgi:hypothetical protein
MKPEQQRIAIAEACGIVSRDQWGPLYKTALGVVRVCPDYLTDLNAMHEAEKVLSDEQFFDWSKDKHTDMSYNGHLFRLVDNSTPGNRPCRYHSPTAAQRAEAFLKTIGKWEEKG